jgi:hypothetical protein
MGAFEAIIESLPHELQERIRERLQITAKAQVRQGYKAASYFSRALSGELHPSQVQEHAAVGGLLGAAGTADPNPRPRLRIIQGGAA